MHRLVLPIVAVAAVVSGDDAGAMDERPRSRNGVPRRPAWVVSER